MNSHTLEMTFAQYASRLAKACGPLPGGDYRDVMFGEVATILRMQAKDTFQRATTPEGEPWKPVTEYTLANRLARKSRHNPQPLVDTGALYKSVTRKGAPYAVSGYNSGASLYRFGTSRPFADSHQEGSGRVPRRKFLGFGREADRDILRVIADRRLERFLEILRGG